jgi:hypothetical protein
MDFPKISLNSQTDNGIAYPRRGHLRSRGKEVSLYSIFNLSARLGWVVNTRPWSLYPREKDPAPIVYDSVWPQARSGCLLKIYPLLGFNPRIVQPVASRYANYTILATPKCVCHSVK